MCSGGKHECEQNSERISLMRDSILNSVAQSNGFFKSQQVNDPDLTFSEKYQMADDILNSNLSLFLQRYWKYIRLEDITYFNSSDDYEVKFYVREIERNHLSNGVRIRNRRYEALKRMVKEGSYFSESEMKKRNPFMYEQLIGQYLTEEERIAEYKRLHENDKFSHFLMGQLEKNVENCLYNEQKNEDEALQVEEEDTDLMSDESELEDEEPQKMNITKEEQILLKTEFTNIMYEHFLAGKDQEFDYSSVDQNDEYDSVDQRNLDEEEKYFDED